MAVREAVVRSFQAALINARRSVVQDETEEYYTVELGDGPTAERIFLLSFLKIRRALASVLDEFVEELEPYWNAMPTKTGNRVRSEFIEVWCRREHRSRLDMLEETARRKGKEHAAGNGQEQFVTEREYLLIELDALATIKAEMIQRFAYELYNAKGLTQSQIDVHPAIQAINAVRSTCKESLALAAQRLQHTGS